MVDRWRVPKGPATHVSMSGGILNVPDNEIHDFHGEYIQAINSGAKLYLVEQKTDHFRFFVDLDYKAPEKLSDDDLFQFCSIIHESLETTSPCLIARARPRPVESSLVKSGVHIHWPELVVSRTKAMNLRTKIIMKLTECFPFDWDKIIDASVYGGSGLRMLWSHKKPTGDPYIPWRSLDGRIFSKEPSTELLNLFSVRTTDEPNLEENFENVGPIEDYIRKYLDGQERTHVKKVQRHEHDGWFVQTDSTYCECIKRRHKSNHVWFTIRSGRISQRCFDDDCREFRGQEHILPPSIVEQLKDVAIVGSPSTHFLMDILPDGATGPVQKVRTHGASVLGSGPGELETFFKQSPKVRTVGFEPSR